MAMKPNDLSSKIDRNKTDKDIWIFLVEASTSELHTFINAQQNLFETNDMSSSYAYAQTLLNCYEFHIEGMFELRTRLRKEPNMRGTFFFKLIQLRTLFLKMRQFKKNTDQSKRVIQIASIMEDIFNRESQSSEWLSDLFRAESCFLISDLFFRCGKYSLAQSYSVKAILIYQRLGAIKKSLRCEYNMAIDHAHLNSQKSHLAKFYYLLEKAKKIKDTNTMASCYHSLAHEYECLGSYRNSLRAIDRAISLSLKNHISGKTSEYFAHKVDLLMKMELPDEARFAVENLKIIPSPFSKKVLNYLAGRYPQLFKFISDDLSFPEKSWEDKILSKDTLGNLEETLLSLLARKPLEKSVLIDELYGQKISYESSEARFKNLIYRLRKRYPDLIKFKNGCYSLTEPLSSISKKAAQ